MKSALEQTYDLKRAAAEALIEEEWGDGALEALFSFSDLDCIIDLKLEEGWSRYVFLEGGEGEPSTLRRIG